MAVLRGVGGGKTVVEGAGAATVGPVPGSRG
jgi:hypothetical protein